MAQQDIHEMLTDEWRESVIIPAATREKFGAFSLFEFAGLIAVPVWEVGVMYDRLAVWILARQDNGDMTNVGVLFDGQIVRSNRPLLAILLQSAVDQWERLSQPLEEGGVLAPSRRWTGITQDEKGRLNVPLQPVMLQTRWAPETGLLYYYDRSKYRIERVGSAEGEEAFRLVER